MPSPIRIEWTDYLQHRATTRGYSLTMLEEVLRYSEERYRDSETGRLVVIGRHGNQLVMIPYEIEVNVMTPVTVHSTSRQQIRFRLQSGRLTVE
ncbi:MAG: hypothetical protein DWI57_01275 [Chloroflexi bacterium]|nr:MAG: hypothetical protein DWI57_01275 [Chloroflexota bacterium]